MKSLILSAAVVALMSTVASAQRHNAHGKNAHHATKHHNPCMNESLEACAALVGEDKATVNNYKARCGTELHENKKGQAAHKRILATCNTFLKEHNTHL